MPGPCQRAEEVMKHESDSDANKSLSPSNNSKQTTGIDDLRKIGNCQADSTTEINQNA